MVRLNDQHQDIETNIHTSSNTNSLLVGKGAEQRQVGEAGGREETRKAKKGTHEYNTSHDVSSMRRLPRQATATAAVVMYTRSDEDVCISMNGWVIAVVV